MIPLLSVGDVGGLPYYMMPFVEGQTLRARLAAVGALPVTEAVRLLRALRRPYDWGRTAYARAQLAAARGDADGALSLLRTALAGGVPYGPLLHADPAFAPLRADPRWRELLRPKG